MRHPGSSGMYVRPRKNCKISCAGTETATDKADRDLQIECEASEAIQCKCAKADESKCQLQARGGNVGGDQPDPQAGNRCVRQWSALLESDREKEWIMQRTARNARRFC
jgi:hypothetical protein